MDKELKGSRISEVRGWASSTGLGVVGMGGWEGGRCEAGEEADVDEALCEKILCS